jgi:hypothetical protein
MVVQLRKLVDAYHASAESWWTLSETNCGVRTLASSKGRHSSSSRNRTSSEVMTVGRYEPPLGTNPETGTDRSRFPGSDTG